jgi:hypothetical protein
MKLRKCIPVLAAVLVFSTMHVFAVEVRTDYDHKVSFAKYKTYSWVKVETPDAIWDQRVKDEIDKTLAAKGWTQVVSGGDVSVVAIGTTRERPTLETFYNGFDSWRWGGFGTPTTTVDNYTEGTLVVDMLDTATERLIWRGSASDLLSSKPEKNIEKLEKAVKNMLEKFLRNPNSDEPRRPVPLEELCALVQRLGREKE